MKRLIAILFFILSFTMPSFASTVGGPEIALPEDSLTKKSVVTETLDFYEATIDIRGAVEAELITKMELETSNEVTNLELEGINGMIKLSNNFYNIVEPYVKVGTSFLDFKWRNSEGNVDVDTDNGYLWAVGVKACLAKMEKSGIKLTLDAQFRNYKLDIKETKLNASKVTRANENIDIEEWQYSLLASKRFVVPLLLLKDYYLVPYTGVTYTSLDAHVYFMNPENGIDFSTYHANAKEPFGLVFGCDILPSLLSWYLFNIEARLVSETSVTIGGKVRF